MYKFIIGNGVFFPLRKKFILTMKALSKNLAIYFQISHKQRRFLMFPSFNFYFIYFILRMVFNTSYFIQLCVLLRPIFFLTSFESSLEKNKNKTKKPSKKVFLKSTSNFELNAYANLDTLKKISI